MFNLDHKPVSTTGSCINISVVFNCAILLLQLISLSSELERHNNDSLQIYLPVSNVQSSYSLISSFTKLLPKTSNKTAKSSLPYPSQGKEQQQQQHISPSYFVLVSTTSPSSGNDSDYLTYPDSSATDRPVPLGPNHSSISFHPLGPPDSNETNSESSLDHKKLLNTNTGSEKHVNISSQHVHKSVVNDYDFKESNNRRKHPVSSSPQSEMTTRVNYFPELNSSLTQDLYIDYKLLGEYNASSSNLSLYPDDLNSFNSTNTTLPEEPLADILLLGGLSVLLGVMILVTVIGK